MISYLFDNYLGVEIIERCISIIGPDKFRDICQHISKEVTLSFLKVYNP